MKIARMHKVQSGNLLAFFDVKTDDGLIVKGFKLIEGANGKFAGFPSQKGKDGEYHDTVFADKDTRGTLNKLAIEHYQGEPSRDDDDDMPF